MEKSYIVQGKGLEEALSKGAVVLGCAKERVGYELLQDARPGRYGQPGTLCKLRVTPVTLAADEAAQDGEQAEAPPIFPLPPSWNELAALPCDAFLVRLSATLAEMGTTNEPPPPPPDEHAPTRREIAGGVSFATGSVRHTGDVFIHGSVRKGMTVQASGSIHVVGAVEEALLDAGGDIVIDEGLFGTARSAAGEIKCRFAQGAQITALRGDVTIAESAMHCRIHAGRGVAVGDQVVGGTCYGEAGVRARVAGATSAAPTVLMAGRNRRLSDQIEIIRRRAGRCVAWLAESEAVRAELRPPEEAGESPASDDRARLWQAEACRAHLHAELRHLAHQKSRLLGMINAERTSRISVLDRAHPNVRILIDDAGREIQKVTHFATFTKDYEAGELRLTSYQ